LATPLTQSQKDAAKKAIQDGNTGLMSPSLNDAKPDGEPGSSGDAGKKPAKELKLTANIYTVAYCAFMKKNKEKYRLKSNDQIDIFFRAIFMLMV
jgi:hypothetical protein